MRVLTLLFAVLCALSPLRAQNVAAVVNVGDWTPRLTFGTIAAAFGENLSAGTCVASQLPLPNELCGLQVTIRDATGAEALAPLFYVSPSQINFLFPFGQWLNGKDPIRRQQTSFTVDICTGGACFNALLNALPEPAILEWQSAEGLQAVLTHADGRVVTPEAPAEWGETLVLYAVGFSAFNGAGQVAPGFPADGFPAPTDRLVTLMDSHIMQVVSEVGGLPIGERYVTPLFVGLAPGFVGLSQINFTLSCLLSNSREPRIYVETLTQTSTKAFTIPMSDAAKAAWGERDCRN